MSRCQLIPIHDYMTPAVQFADKQDSILDAYERLREEHVQQLPVLEHGKLVGLISAGDLALVEHMPRHVTERIPVGTIMNTEVYTVGPDAAVDAVARQMAKHKYHAVLVVVDGEAQGVFTTTDALRALSDSLTDSLPDGALED